MDYSKLNNVLLKTFDISEDTIENYSLEVNNLPFLKLRDILMKLGTIYLEDFENQIYVATIKGGFFKMNNAHTAIQLDENCLKLSISAKEGLLNQHTIEGAINELKNNIIKYLK